MWVSKYSYQLWDLGEYDGNSEMNATKVYTIPMWFGLSNISETKDNECTTSKVAGGTRICKVGDYMTHPFFIQF